MGLLPPAWHRGLQGHHQLAAIDDMANVRAHVHRSLWGIAERDVVLAVVPAMRQKETVATLSRRSEQGQARVLFGGGIGCGQGALT